MGASTPKIVDIFFARGERFFGRRPLYPDDPVDPVQLLFKDKNPFLLFSCETKYKFLLRLNYQLFRQAAGLKPDIWNLHFLTNVVRKA